MGRGKEESFKGKLRTPFPSAAISLSTHVHTTPGPTMARAELYFRYLRGLNHHPAISKIESLALIDSSALLALFKKKLILREATELSE